MHNLLISLDKPDADDTIITTTRPRPGHTPGLADCITTVHLTPGHTPVPESVMNERHATG